MIYKDFKGKQLSALGLGCMRLPQLDSYENVDMDALKVLVDRALAGGVNYFDTAWGYHGGNSETAMGQVLSAYPRDSYFLASKFPCFERDKLLHVREIFEKQLEKCQTEYFDFYLIHNLSEHNVDDVLDPQYGILEYLLEQKRLGRIRHFGFSTHGSLETVTRFLDAWGEHMEFCQIQLNWLDWTLQNARLKVELLNRREIPVWVMEPVRGGSLCKLDPAYEEKLRALCPQRSVPEWGFRFLQGIPGVTMILSGMSNLEQLDANVATFSEDAPLDDHENTALLEIARAMTSCGTLPCTGCRYCTPHCPQGLNIPWLIEIYNGHKYAGHPLSAKSVSAVDESSRPTACVGCRACEEVCPQNIRISEMMAEFAENIR